MPSPFPGMDPYLESPDWFPDLHDGLIFIKGRFKPVYPAVLCAVPPARLAGLEHRRPSSRTWTSCDLAA